MRNTRLRAHPCALTHAEEEALQRSRLSARRGLSAEDMRKLREQQALADQVRPGWPSKCPVTTNHHHSCPPLP